MWANQNWEQSKFGDGYEGFSDFALVLLVRFHVYAVPVKELASLLLDQVGTVFFGSQTPDELESATFLTSKEPAIEAFRSTKLGFPNNDKPLPIGL